MRRQKLEAAFTQERIIAKRGIKQGNTERDNRELREGSNKEDIVRYQKEESIEAKKIQEEEVRQYND